MSLYFVAQSVSNLVADRPFEDAIVVIVYALKNPIIVQQ
jgi:hypothetical protein